MALQLLQTRTFALWLGALKDVAGKAVILQRLMRVARGQTGDAKSLG